MTGSADHPYPPLELASRVFTITGWKSDPFRAYEEIGAQTARALVRLLPDDWSFERKRVLDFGSGAGRTLRHFLSEAETAEFRGTDIDRPSIEWLEQNLCPPLHAWQSEGNPPLGLEHGSFYLAWAISVFTHLTDNSIPWLLELHRLLKPGGLLIATYMRWQSESFAGEPWNEDRVGMNVLHRTAEWDRGGPAVLMSDWWVRAHWGRAFEILEVAPEIHNMSSAVIRKRDLELTSADLERPDDDPREFAALRHNLRQIQREVFDLAVEAAHERSLREQEVAELRRGYEGSLRWRLTRPLRAGERLPRSLRVRRPCSSGGLATRGIRLRGATRTDGASQSPSLPERTRKSPAQRVLVSPANVAQSRRMLLTSEL
jgi:SAM-dependent methyltransferase